jgi:hypothetical protein
MAVAVGCLLSSLVAVAQSLEVYGAFGVPGMAREAVQGLLDGEFFHRG